MILAGLIGGFVTAGNFIIPLALLFVAMALMFVINKGVDEVTSDERVDKIAGKAAKLVFTVSALLIAVTGLILIAIRATHPELYLMGNVFAYISCGMIFIYTILFKYYSRKG